MSKSDAKALFNDEQGGVVVSQVLPGEGGVLDEGLNRCSVTSGNENEKNSKSFSVPLIRVIVDEDFSVQSANCKQANTFECHYEDKNNPKENFEESYKSIFETKPRSRLLSSDNERCSNLRPTNVASTPEHFLPVLTHSEHNKENPQESRHCTTNNHCLFRASETDKKKKKTRRLYDYNDRDYLEQSRKTRRRKQSEVDIEIGIRLSRFTQTPYEGCVDKYSKKNQQKRALERRTRVITQRTPASSSDNSPLGSSSEYINVKQVSPRLLDCNESDTRSDQNYRRERRTRSQSISPPRSNARSASTRSFLGIRSHNSSPIVSPSSSIGPSSPALSRYRSSNFTTILNSSSNCKQLVQNQEKILFPDIHLSKFSNKHRVDSKTQSTTNISQQVRSSQTKLLLEFENLNSTMEKTRSHQHKKESEAISISSPDSLRKHVLLNTTVPCGSPTFQRAMAGLQNPSKQSSKNEKRPKSPAVKKGSPTLVRMRTSSVGGRRKIIRRMPSMGSPKPHHGYRVSFREKSDEFANDDATIAEMHDKLTDLKVNDDVQILPKKSILKNRRRSIDDLDIGTKKGLALYLKSKQRQAC